MAQVYPPDGVTVEIGTWGVDFDVNTAITNTSGQSCIEYKNTARTTELNSDYYPCEGLGGSGAGGRPYKVEFIVRGDSIAAGNTLQLDLDQYLLNKTFTTGSACWDAVLPAANTWYKMTEIVNVAWNCRWLRWSCRKTHNTAWTLYLDYAGFQKHPYGFAAYAGGATSIGAGWTKVNFNTEHYDYGFAYDTTNSRFTAPIDGLYHFDGAVTFASGANAGDQMCVAIYVNGASVRTSSNDACPANNFAWQGHISADIELARGDYVELWAYEGSRAVNTYVAGSQWTRFEGHEIW